MINCPDFNPSSSADASSSGVFNPETHTLIRCNSHRARYAVERLQGRTIGFYSWDTGCTGGFVAVANSQLSAVLDIKGCSRASSRFTYSRCWSNV